MKITNTFLKKKVHFKVISIKKKNRVNKIFVKKMFNSRIVNSSDISQLFEQIALEKPTKCLE
jgi:hypothetical protein